MVRSVTVLLPKQQAGTKPVDAFGVPIRTRVRFPPPPDSFFSLMNNNTICRLIHRKLKQGPLPGEQAQLKMAPEYPESPKPPDSPRSPESHRSPDSPTKPRQYSPPPGVAPRRAAVLILLTPPMTAPRIPLILRAEDGGAHAGQISIPGGSHEGNETYPVETALREAREEIGLDTGELEILGPLSPLFISVSDFLVTPVLACTDRKPDIRPDGIEAKGIFWFELEILLRPPPTGSFRSNSRGRLTAPYYPFDGGRVWGATAMMLSELGELLKDAKIISST